MRTVGIGFAKKAPAGWSYIRMDVAIVIPVYNQIAYTQGCLRGLAPDMAEGVAVVIVDNGSTDGTAEWLDQQAGIKVIHNAGNRGCAAAWNQGCAAVPAAWTIILNNDVLLPVGWRSALLGAADRAGLDIVSPAMREGEQNYNFGDYAREFAGGMATVVRRGHAHGVCFAVRREVFARIGGFDEAFRIGQFEDADFFRRARGVGFALGTTGACLLHHFGSATQNALRSGPATGPYESENRAHFRKKWRLNWVRRRWERSLLALRLWAWRTRERRAHGHTLHEKWQAGRLRFY
jgi:N-acetylglucosaminyl-diphospho-decaprenol L-rhamnosyltransferase